MLMPCDAQISTTSTVASSTCSSRTHAALRASSGAVSVSPRRGERRLDRLEQLGTIAGYHAVLDHARLGNEIEAFVELRFAGTTQVDDIEGTVAGMPEVVEAFTTAGDPDALVRVRATDLDHLKRVVDRIRRSGTVTGTKTLIVLGAARPSARARGRRARRS